MGALAALKSLPAILAIVAALGGGAWVWFLKSDIDDLKTKLQHCEDRRAIIKENRDALAEDLDEIQKRAEKQKQRLEAARQSQAEREAKLRNELQMLESRLQERLGKIDRTYVPEDVQKRIAQCERAREVLVRPSSQD